MYRLAFKFVFVLCFSFSVAQAQEYNFKNYTVDDGLASPEVYCSLQDSYGYIWFGTDRGVCRFNGYDFQTFTTADGLVYNTVFSFFEDHKKRIWILSNSNQLCYFERGQIWQHKANPLLKKRFPNVSFQSVFIDNGDTAWLMVNEYGLVKISPDNNITDVYNGNKQYLKIFDDKNFIYQNGGDSLLMVKMPANAPAIKINFHHDFPYRRQLCIRQSPTKFLLAHNKYNRQVTAFDLNGNITTKLLDYQVISAFKTKTNELWLGSRSKGVFCYKNNDFRKPERQFLKDATVTSILQDEEGNFWFTTLEDGVFLLRTLNVLSYFKIDADDNNKYTAVFANDSNLWIGTDKGFTYKVNPKNAFYKYRKIETAVVSISQINNSELWLGSNSGNYIIKNNTLLENIGKTPYATR
ncbi:MAG: hypothetical protein EOP53_23735, partial [Sphingobacteriales bacterium]